jgi:hypothetical protein
MQFVLKAALREQDVELLDQLVAEANEAERLAGGPPAYDRERMLVTIGLNGLVEEYERRRLGQADHLVLGASEVEYGRTFNLGNYESERIGVRLPIEVGQAPQETLDRARRWVEQQHGQGVEVRRLEQRLATLNLQIKGHKYDLQQIAGRLDAAVQEYERLRELAAQQGAKLLPFHAYVFHHDASLKYITACNRLQIALHAPLALAEQAFALLSAEAEAEAGEELRAALETVRQARGQADEG